MMQRKFTSIDMHATVHLETFSSCADLFDTCRERKLQWNEWARHDYFGSAKPFDPDWSGFRNPQELWDKVQMGSDDDETVMDIKKVAGAVKVQEKDKLRKLTLSVAGGAVNIPRYLQGNPNCMYTMTKKKVKSRIINIGVDCGVSCFVDGKSVKRVGKAVVCAIASLEKMGFRVRLDSLASIGSNARRGKKTGVLLDLRLKNEGETMNIGKMLYPIADISYLRGIMFGWMVRNKDMPHDDGLGYPGNHYFSERELNAMYEEAVGKGAIVFNMSKMVDLAEKMTDAELTKYIEDKCLEE